MKYSIKNGLFIFILSIITAGLFVMANPIDNIFAIKNEGGKNTDKESTTDSLPSNSNKKEGCSPLDPRC